MNIHEFQAKSIMRSYGIHIPEGYPSSGIQEALEIGKKLLQNGSEVVVVKAQIHAGGRGKGGGVKVAKTCDEVAEITANMLHHCLITNQTGPEGRVVKKVYIESGVKISHEMYFSLIIDRKNNCIRAISSASGGVDIEEVAKNTSEKIISFKINPSIGIKPFHYLALYKALSINKDERSSFNNLISKIYQIFIDKNLMQLEINPLVRTDNGEFIPLDAKMVFDDNALPKMPEISEFFDKNEYNPMEIQAQKFDLNYIKMKGNIGCMVNGAGLAMATMDIISLYGGDAANFLDVGGGATAEKVAEGFKIILSDKNVKVIFVNIFGGIMRCDIIAEGIISAAQNLKLSVPIVVRLDGTNADLGKKMFAKVESLPNIYPCDNLDDAAKMAVNLWKNISDDIK